MSAFSIPKKSNQPTENPQVQTKTTATSQDPTLEVAGLRSKETTDPKDPPDVVCLPEKLSVENGTNIALQDLPPAVVEMAENPAVKTKTRVAFQDPILEVVGLPSKD
eukprot:10190180-Ditylum_brightwellii.AAC.1